MCSQPLISVIVPVYNVENCIKKCLDSILNQTFTNLDIVIIDDGSTDESFTILQEYSKYDQRIRLFHQKNQGISTTRNNGVKYSRGEYLTFVDSDDYVSEDYVEFLYNLIKKTNFRVKMALCSLVNVYSYTGEQQDCGNGKEYLLSGKKCIEKMCYNDMVDTCCYAKLTKKELYTNISFPNGELFEDIATTYQLFDQCEYIACGFVSKYYYFIHSNTIVTGNFNLHKFDLLKMTDQMASFVVKKYPDLEKAVLRKQVWARFSTLNQTLNVSYDKNIVEKRKNILDFISKNRLKIILNRKASLRDKIGCIALIFGFKIYKNIWNGYLKLSKKR